MCNVAYFPGVAFFMIFGGDNIAGYKTFNDVMFSMLRITLVDDYNFEVSTQLFWIHVIGATTKQLGMNDESWNLFRVLKRSTKRWLEFSVAPSS